MTREIVLRRRLLRVSGCSVATKAELEKYERKNHSLRAERNDLKRALGEMSQLLGELEGAEVPPIAKLVGKTLGLSTAYGGSRLNVLLQQKGLSPTAVPVDGLIGLGLQAWGGLSSNPWMSVVEQAGDGLTFGALGRLGALHQLEEAECEGRIAALLPAPNAASDGKKK